MACSLSLFCEDLLRCSLRQESVPLSETVLEKGLFSALVVMRPVARELGGRKRCLTPGGQ